MQPSIFTSQPFQPLASRVAGHAGMHTTGDGSLIVKPAFPAELQFYQTLLPHPSLAPLRPHIPTFLGALQPGAQVNGSQSTKWGGMNIPPGRTQSLILENLSHRFIKSNTLDVKLGTVCYDEFAPPDKIARREKTARETTSFETGIRLTEFQVTYFYCGYLEQKVLMGMHYFRCTITSHPKSSVYLNPLERP